MKEPLQQVRLDKWLWAVRLYKTRKLANQACNAGKIKIENTSLKASKMLKGGEILTIQSGALTRTIKVLSLLENRIPASRIAEFYEDLTPAEEYENLKLIQQSVFYRQKGLGRPTKKERRLLDKWRNK